MLVISGTRGDLGHLSKPKKGPTASNFCRGIREQGSGIYRDSRKMCPDRRLELETDGHKNLISD